MILDEKLNLEQKLIDLKEDLAVKLDKEDTNRDELIKNRVKNSQLETQDIELIEEEKQLLKENEEFVEANKQAD